MTILSILAFWAPVVAPCQKGLGNPRSSQTCNSVANRYGLSIWLCSNGLNPSSSKTDTLPTPRRKGWLPSFYSNQVACFTRWRLSKIAVLSASCSFGSASGLDSPAQASFSNHTYHKQCSLVPQDSLALVAVPASPPMYQRVKSNSPYSAFTTTVTFNATPVSYKAPIGSRHDTRLTGSLVDPAAHHNVTKAVPQSAQ
jgi:hypothetical protein